MKTLLLTALLLGPGLALAQTTTAPATPAPASPAPAATATAPAATINFCGITIPVPAGCTPQSSYQLTCNTYQLSWFYLNYGQLQPVVAEMLRTEKKKHKRAEQQDFNGFILDTPAKGHRLSYTTETGMGYQLIFYGTAKGQPVVVQLTMGVDPSKTADLPEVARRIVRLDK